jgi:hypothetical protein
MRKLFMLVMLTISFVAATDAANAYGDPPECGSACPWVR